MLIIGNTYKFELVGEPTAYVIGQVTQIRDTSEKPISQDVVLRKPNVERSRFLLTIKEQSGKLNSFYLHLVKDVKPVGWMRNLKERLV